MALISSVLSYLQRSSDCPRIKNSGFWIFTIYFLIQSCEANLKIQSQDIPANSTVGDQSNGTVTDGTNDPVSNQGSGARKLVDPNCLDPDLTKIEVGNRLTLCDGSVGEGSLVVSSTPIPCGADGAKNCLVDGVHYVAAQVTAFAPSDIKSGVTVAGVLGTATIESHSSCTTDGASGCVVVGPAFKAADMANVTPGNIKSGLTIAGVVGTYPSVTTPLAGSTATADLDLATFDAKMKSSSSFEWFDSAGGHYSNTGDVDIASANISNGVTIFGVTGNYGVACTADGQQNCIVSGAYKAANPTGVSGGDIRIGRSLAGVTGTLKTNCRNTINSSKYNWDGPIASLSTTASTTGTVNDFWDTVDDYYGWSPTTVTGWSTDTVCDSTSWTDVTTTDGGATTTTCALSAANCQYKDNISNLIVTGLVSSTQWWPAGIRACNSSTYGGFPAGTWRMPTQKELLSLYEHGIVSLASANYMTLAVMRVAFLTASTFSPVGNQMWIVTPATGEAAYTPGNKGSVYNTLCVR